MSLEEYNKHSILGPLAGPATTVSSIAGQEAYRRNHETTVLHPASSTPLNVGGAFLIVAILAAVGACAAGAAFVLPETLAAIAAIIAAGCFIAAVIIALHAGAEACKIAAAAALGVIFSRSWGWIIGGTLSAYIFAEIYIYAIIPAEAWMVAACAALLGVAAKYMRKLRIASAAAAIGFATYTLAVSYLFGKQPMIAALIGVGATVLIFTAAQLWQARRKNT